jgi:hypothetical protein
MRLKAGMPKLNGKGGGYAANEGISLLSTEGISLLSIKEAILTGTA